MSRYRQTMSEALKQVREATQKPYVSMSSGGQYNVLDKDGKTAYSTRDQRLAQNYLKKNYDNLKEVSDHEISMARGELEAIADKATQLAGALQGKSDDGNPLEAWVQSKITKAKDYINSVSDYLMYNPDMKQNEENSKEIQKDKTDNYKDKNKKLEEAKIISDISGVSINTIKKEVMPFNVKVGRVGPGMDSDYEVEFTGSEPNLIKYAKKHLDFDGNNFSQLKKHLAMEETELEEGFSSSLKQKAKELAKKFANNMTKAVDEIEKLAKGLSDEPEVYKTIKQYNEQLEEKYTVVITKKDGSTMELGRYNTPAEAQRYVDMYGKGAKVKKEEVELDEIDEKISDIFKANKEGESNKESEIQSLKDQIAMLKQKLENEKNKAIKPEPNPETGEVPLTIGIAHAEFKKKKEEEVKEENLQELSKAERDKRIQRAKDMIKYYDAQKKAALKGPNKALAKKMLKNETELEEVTQKEIDKFHTALDNLVHKTFGHSSDEKKKEKMDEKVADSIIKDLQKAYAPMKGKTISPEMANKISKHLDQKSYDLDVLRQLKKADIPFISTIARNKIYKKTGKFEQSNNPKDMDKHFKTLSIKAQTKVNELLRQGMGYWDAVAKAKRMYNEDRRLYVEGIAGLQKKADKSGMPYSILKKVYDRGMAAWKSGHRPGASQQQWAFARVNSFITKSSGTWGGADKDLAAKVKGSK